MRRLALLATMLHAAAAAAAAAVLSNGDFEDGLRGWNITCDSPERCGGGVAATAHDGGGHVAAFHASAEDWTAVELRQRLPDASGHGDAFSVEGNFRAGPDSWRAPLELRLSIVYEAANGGGTVLGRCDASRLVLDKETWERVSVSCARPADAPAAVVAWVSIGFACVRSQATLLVDNIVAQPAVGAAAPATIPPAEVPRIIHFIFGLSGDFGGKPFGLVHYLVIKAALNSVSPTLAYFHHYHEPSGEWWEKTKPLIALRKVKPPTTIFGRQLRRFAHQADVLRLELLLQYGGVYMDMDVMLIKPITHLMSSPPPGGLILAHEGIDGTIGAGNAMMLCTRNASVMVDWYSHYRSFSDSVWNGFSVRLPMQLAIATPGSTRLLGYTAFYWPPWNPWGISQLYRSPRCLMPESLGVHLWETKMYQSLLGKLTAEIVNKRDTCFARMASAVLDGSFDFSKATLEPEQAAETVDTLIMQRDLEHVLEAAPEGEKAESHDPLPMELAKFRRK